MRAAGYRPAGLCRSAPRRAQPCRPVVLGFVRPPGVVLERPGPENRERLPSLPAGPWLTTPNRPNSTGAVADYAGVTEGRRAEARRGGGAVRLLLVVPLILYGAGLTYEIAEPWIGMHDWNGAFFSQLARNFLRYPWAVGHGMPVVAVGDAVPPPAERSIYATHPPGLVWLVAGAFRLFGEHEWAARLVPIAASLGSLVLLLWIVVRQCGLATALLAGLLYAVMPMAVFYGRMVDHEAVCLFGMLAAMWSWELLADPATAAARRRWLPACMVLALFGTIWVDWPGVLFAGLFAAQALIQWRRGTVRPAMAVLVCGAALLGTASMLIYLLHFGLDGRLRDLFAIFTSRTGSVDLTNAPGPEFNAVQNLTWPLAVLIGAGLIVSVSRRPGAGAVSRAPAVSAEPAAPAVSAVSPVPAGLWAIGFTGALWMLVFWRQFSIHGYWAFYLGPICALLAARASWAACVWLRLRYPAWGATALVMLALSAVMVAEARGALTMFAAEWYGRLPEISAWQEIHRRTRPGDRVLLSWDPIVRQQHGGYEFRNITPPQLAYYLDRPLDVERDLTGAAERARDHACYVVPWPEAFAHQAEMRFLCSRFAVYGVGTKVVVDFRNPSTSTGPSTTRAGS